MDRSRRVTEEALIEYALGMLDADGRTAVERAVEGDEGLAGELASIRWTLDATRGGPVGEPLEGAALDEFVKETLSRVDAETAGEGTPTSRRPAAQRARSARMRRARTAPSGKILWLAPLAAACAIFIAVVLVRERPEADARPEKLAAPSRPADGGDADSSLRQARAQTVRPPLDSGAKETERMDGLPPPARPEVALEDVETKEAERAAVEETESLAAEPRTPAPFASLRGRNGLVYYRRDGGKWNEAVEGIRLVGGNEVDTRMGTAVVDLDGGGRVYLNKNTWLGFERDALRLRRGEVCCEFGGAEGIRVSTADGIVRHLGTRFSVKATPAGTRVTVEEGRVLVQNEKGEVRVDGGHQAWVHKDSAPGRPRKVDAARVMAWAQWKPDRRRYAPGDAVLSVNFQPAGAPVPQGFVADTGEQFDPGRGFGWSVDRTSGTRLRKGSADARKNTMIFGGSLRSVATWEYVLPNGLYFVTAGSGDPDYWQGPNRITVEGRVAIGDPVLQAGRFVEGEVLVEVRDGRLTVEIGARGNPTKSTNTDTAFNYLVIRRAVRRR